MFLMRAFLNPDSAAVRADLTDPEGLHKTVMRTFADLAGPQARQEQAILHRLDRDGGGRLVLLVQGRVRPDPARWLAGYVADVGSDLDLAFSQAENPVVRDVANERASIEAGCRFLFRLKANTTKRLSGKGPSGSESNKGKRVPVRGDDARREWLARHAAAAGFRCDVVSVKVSELAPEGRSSGKRVTFAGAMFDGILEVEDAAKFRLALEHGVGPAKAYGFGLLSIAAVPRRTGR
jgi:CRISPR system Cascade subunit CasE